jgi:hypothetical protein
MPETPDGEPNVSGRVLEPSQSPHVATPFLKVACVPEASSRDVSCFGGGETALSESSFAELNVDAHLLLELRGIAIAEKKESQPAKGLGHPSHIVVRPD